MKRAMPTINRRCMSAVLPRIIALAMVAVLSAYVAADPSKLREGEMSAILTAADNGRTVELRVGGDVVLRLPENPATGYRWAVDAVDETFVDIKEGQYRAASNTLGGGGEAQWTVHAKAPGLTQVKLKHWRHWEGERSVIERYELTFRIQP
jgi:inhibitor of cysteine peptidase